MDSMLVTDVRDWICRCHVWHVDDQHWWHRCCSFRLSQCWWRMLETKCIDDQFDISITDLASFVTNIVNLSPTSLSPILWSTLKMSPTFRSSHLPTFNFVGLQPKKILNGLKGGTPLRPIKFFLPNFFFETALYERAESPLSNDTKLFNFRFKKRVYWSIWKLMVPTWSNLRDFF